MDALTVSIREAYAKAFLEPDDIWPKLAPQVVFHVAGGHPLSGDHVGVDAVRRYVATVTARPDGPAGFSVTSAFRDHTGALLLVEGTAFHGEEPFVRTIVHLVRLEEGKVVELWDNPIDQRAEDEFWSARMPARRTRRPSAAPTGARTTGGIPAELMRALRHC
jgi:ketosteroid isomerase-like protein